MPLDQSSKTRSTNDEKLTVLNVPSLHGMVKVSISGEMDDHSLTFYSAIAQMVPSLIRKDWDCGTVSIKLSLPEGDTLLAFMSVMRLDTTAT
jgi:hypothetical protein